jgi:hypothetical protein
MTMLLEHGADSTVLAAEPTPRPTQTIKEMSFLRDLGCTCITDPTLRSVGFRVGEVECYVVGSWEGSEGWWEDPAGNNEAYDNEVFYVDRTCVPPKKELMTPYPVSRRSATELAVHLMFSRFAADSRFSRAA